MKKEECQQLYEEYKKLKEVMDDVFQARDVVPNRPIITKLAPPFEDMERFDELKSVISSECKECLELTPSEWFEMRRI